MSQPNLKESEDLFTTEDLIEMDNNIVTNQPAEVSEDIFNALGEPAEQTETEDIVDEPVEEAMEDDSGKTSHCHQSFSLDLFFSIADIPEGTEVEPVTTSTIQKRISELPLARVKHIIKLDPEVNLVNGS